MYNEYDEYYNTEDHLLALVYGSCEDYNSHEDYEDNEVYEIMDNTYED